MWQTKMEHNVIRKWIRNRPKANVVRQDDNQAPTLGLAHERRHVHMISKGEFVRSEANFCLCKQFA